MSDPHTSRIRRSLRLYASLLYLYPPGFRRRFGPQMLEAFEHMLCEELNTHDQPELFRAWKIVGAELLPTMCRAHFESVANLPSTVYRLPLASIIPLMAFFTIFRLTTSSADRAALVTWFALMFVAMIFARGRGWRCSVYAMIASAIAVSLPALNDAMTAGMTPGPLRVLPLLAIAAATIALILSISVRIVYEGVYWRIPAPA